MKSRIKYWFLAACLGCLPLIALALLPRPTAAAGLWYVAPSGSDASDCQTTGTPCQTINGAIGKAATGDTINVQVGTYTAPSGAQVILITRSVTLLGGWDGSFSTQSGVSTVDGQGLRRGLTVSDTASAFAERFVFQNGLVNDDTGGGGIRNLASLTLAHSRVTGSLASSLAGQGGGVDNSGILTLTESAIDNNTATNGGGLINRTSAQVQIISTTISGNYAGDACCSGGGGGGGIHNYGTMVLLGSSVSGNTLRGGFGGAGIYNAGTLTVTNSTISSNRGGMGEGIYSSGSEEAIYNTTIGSNSGYGLRREFGHTTLRNTILSGNGVQDCFSLSDPNSVITSLGHNLITKNYGCSLFGSDIVGAGAGLNIVANYGGPAPTQALLLSSPAINAGSPGGCFGPNGLLTTDARGYPRAGVCDIGAFEFQTLDASAKSANPAAGLPGQPLRFTISVNNSGSSNMAGVTMTDHLPSGLTYINNSLTASAGSAVQAGDVITWTGSVSAGTSVTIQYFAASLPNASLGTVIVNTAVITGGGQEFVREAVVTLALPKIFLPFIAKPLPGIQGYVSRNGAPAADIQLELRHYNGQAFSTALTTNTDVRGFYNFNSAPSLAAGEIYYVRYLNDMYYDRLSFWGTADITSYTAGGAVAAGNFDIAEIALQTPAYGAEVALPAFLGWALRPATPTDSYQLVLFGAFGLEAQSAPLGYVNGVTVSSLPSGFNTGTLYGWYVNVISPDGGIGTSKAISTVKFTNGLAGSEPDADGGVALEAAKARADSGRP